MTRAAFWVLYFVGYISALAWVLWPTPAHAEVITFPAHVGYRAERLQRVTDVRLKVCPLPTAVDQCASGQGWIDPDDTSPIPGYWLRHVIYRDDGAAVLFFCPNGMHCHGDDQLKDTK